jgi:hypothetical protein
MKDRKLKTAYILSILVIVLSTVASAGGLFIENIYRDNAFVKSAWFHNDIVTLVLAIPILILSLILSFRGSDRAKLVWLGSLFYMTYNFGFYLFGASLNRFFLIYVLIFVLSVFALIFGLSRLDIQRFHNKFSHKIPVKPISAYMIIWALLLTVAWVSQTMGYFFTGELPQIMIDSGGKTNLVAIMDLTLIVPPVLLGAVYLWQKKIWGYIVAGMINIMGVIYLVLLIVGTAGMYISGEGTLELLWLWGVLFVGCLISSLLLIWNLRPSTKTDSNANS